MGFGGWLMLGYIIVIVATGGPLYMPFGLWELVGDILSVTAGLGLTGWLATLEWRGK